MTIIFHFYLHPPTLYRYFTFFPIIFIQLILSLITFSQFFFVQLISLILIILLSVLFLVFLSIFLVPSVAFQEEAFKLTFNAQIHLNV